MIACYDLACCPPTYDAVAFLALAELERLRLGEDHIDVRILPGPASGFRADGLGTWPHTIEERVRLRDDVLVPLCRLLPSVRSVEVVPDPRTFGWGKGENHIGLKNILGALRAGCRPLRGKQFRLVRGDGGWDRRPLVTLTLREAAHHPLRNSRSEEWSLAAEELSEMGFSVIVLRDARLAEIPLLVGATDSAMLQIGDAPTDLAKRASVYAAAALNVGISNGPMWMSIFMDAPTLMLRPTTNAAGGCYDDAFYAQMGLPRGSQMPGAPPHQRLVWEEDSCENIVRAVEGMTDAQHV